MVLARLLASFREGRPIFGGVPAVDPTKTWVVSLQRNLPPPINTDIGLLWTSIIFGFDHCAAPNTQPKLSQSWFRHKNPPPPGFGWSTKKPAAFFPWEKKCIEKSIPWLEGCPVARWDSDFVRGASEGSMGSMGPRFFASGGVGGVEIGSLMFFFWRQQNFKVEKFGEVLCSETFGPDRQMDDVGFWRCFLMDIHLKEVWVISGHFSPQKKGFTISRSLRSKIVCQTRFLWPVITSQMWKFSCLATAKEATLSLITTCFVLQGNNKLSIHRSCAFFDF